MLFIFNFVHILYYYLAIKNAYILYRAVKQIFLYATQLKTFYFFNYQLPIGLD